MLAMAGIIAVPCVELKGQASMHHVPEAPGVYAVPIWCPGRETGAALWTSSAI